MTNRDKTVPEDLDDDFYDDEDQEEHDEENDEDDDFCHDCECDCHLDDDDLDDEDESCPPTAEELLKFKEFLETDRENIPLHVVIDYYIRHENFHVRELSISFKPDKEYGLKYTKVVDKTNKIISLQMDLGMLLSANEIHDTINGPQTSMLKHMRETCYLFNKEDHDFEDFINVWMAANLIMQYARWSDDAPHYDAETNYVSIVLENDAGIVHDIKFNSSVINVKLNS